MISYKKNTNNIVTLTMDMEGRKSNIINHEIGKAFLPVLDHLKKSKESNELIGVIITSAKQSFLTGGDLDYLSNVKDPKEIFKFVERQKQLFNAIESLGVPVVAAINGAALGSGFELTLAAHHRIALDHPKTVLGCPEVTLGILPGGGGTIRLMWMLGIEKALPILAEGKRYNPKKALEIGLIDELVADKETLMQQAEKWILDNPQVSKPWLEKGRIPGGTAKSPKLAPMIAMASAMMVKRTRNNYPAPQAILNTMVEGSLVDFETALRIESRYFTELITGKVSTNMTKAFWYDLNSIKQGESRPKGFGKFRPRKIGVIGAGMMGSGIAYVSAKVGIQVMLKDVSVTIAERGKAYSEKLLVKGVARKKITEIEKAAILDRITPTENAEDFKDCDLIIEAVFENRALKDQVTKEAQKFLDEDVIFASNTSTLPISGLAKSYDHQENFIGLHFFSPVDKMQLVEIIKGDNTSEETIARAFDYVKLIKKTPIVVNDSRGFYTSRVFKTYIIEGMALLNEGNLPNKIEQAGLNAGMPVGPLALIDEVSISLVVDILKQTKKDLGDKDPPNPGYDVAFRMIEEFNRPGKAKKAGFYDYSAKPKKIWPALRTHFPDKGSNSTMVEMQERLMIIQAIETVRCMEEGVISKVADANIGSIFGWGFAPFKGGTLQYINDYGMKEFIEKAAQLEQKYGARFKLPQSLHDMNHKNLTFI